MTLDDWDDERSDPTEREDNFIIRLGYALCFGFLLLLILLVGVILWLTF